MGDLVAHLHSPVNQVIVGSTPPITQSRGTPSPRACLPALCLILCMPSAPAFLGMPFVCLEAPLSLDSRIGTASESRAFRRRAEEVKGKRGIFIVLCVLKKAAFIGVLKLIKFIRGSEEGSCIPQAL